MDATFPFGFPTATAWYLSLYVVTLVVHVFFMNYVLAGSAYLAFVTLFTGGAAGPRLRTPVAMVLRDWMPFALGIAITAGVAPLLFVQILYKKPFYMANVLLSHRWMAVVPVLIAGFYLLYLIRGRRVDGWPPGVRVLAGLGAFLCFAFTAYSWTENHLLSLDERAWPGFYAAGKMMYLNIDQLPRFLLWFVGSIPTMCLIVAWQLRLCERHGEPLPREDVQRLAWLAVGGLVLSCVCGGWYYVSMDAATRVSITGSTAISFLIVAVMGMALQAAVWIALLREGAFSARWLTAVSLGLVLTLTGATVTREAVRLASIDVTALYEKHARAAEVGGLPVFLTFVVLNALVIVWCIRLVKARTRLAERTIT